MPAQARQCTHKHFYTEEPADNDTRQLHKLGSRVLVDLQFPDKMLFLSNFAEQDFLPKNQHTQRKLFNFENWVNGEVSNSAKNLTFKVNFLCQKLSESFSIFFFIEEYQYRSTFFVIDIF